MNARAEVVVVGGGLAGAAAALELARDGRSTVLVERERAAHDKVCGEFLSFEALDDLAALGVDPSALGAVPIETVGLCGKGAPTLSPLPFRALGLSRRILDEALLRRAEDAGVRIIRGSAVRALDRSQEGWTARLADGQAIVGRTAFVATGKHDLKARRRPRGRQNDLIGLKLHLRLSPDAAAAIAGRIELVLFEGGYGGLQPIEDGLANLCCLVTQKRFAALEHGWDALLAAMGADCPHLAERLEGARPVHAKPLAISAIPYGFVRREADGIWHLGDQAAVIPSFAGDGMAIALHSGRLAASFHLAGRTADAFQRRLADDVEGQVRRATWLSRRMVEGWSQAIGLRMARACPPLLRQVALSTRIASRRAAHEGSALR